MHQGEVNLSEDACSVCKTKYVRNFVAFDYLPLVEFVTAKGITLKRALECLKSDPPEENVRPLKAKKKQEDFWQHNPNGDEQTLVFN